ncbi:MAG: hypothetical protein FWC87_06155 [Acidimicrobiaceae bacterium]|nr:hypothetical protein [Acidimicrobiaceae bacterium]
MRNDVGSEITEDTPEEGRPRIRKAVRPRKTRWLLVTVTGLAVGLAGCGAASSGLAVAGGGATTTTAPKGVSSQHLSSQARMLQYSECMRSHGLSDFPDPNSQGQIRVTPGHFPDQGTPQFQAADKTCSSLLPAGNQSPAKRNTNALNFAQCMRSHGVTDFPDPNGQGTIDIKDPTGDLNPNSAAFQDAGKQCQGLNKGFNLLEN